MMHISIVPTQKFHSRLATHLRIAMYAISWPAAWFYLIWVESPELQFLLEKRPTNIRWVMQFASSANEEFINCNDSVFVGFATAASVCCIHFHKATILLIDLRQHNIIWITQSSSQRVKTYSWPESKRNQMIYNVMSAVEIHSWRHTFPCFPSHCSFHSFFPISPFIRPLFLYDLCMCTKFFLFFVCKLLQMDDAGACGIMLDGQLDTHMYACGAVGVAERIGQPRTCACPQLLANM